MSNNSLVVDLICVYNNHDVFNKCIEQSVSNSHLTDCIINPIYINNSSQLYSSMAEAVNAHLNNLQGKYVIIAHQDIIFNSVRSLQDIVSSCSSMDGDFIVGVAGAVFPCRSTITSVDKPLCVDTVDECIFCMSVDLLRRLRFNEHICDNWHLYAVELCIRAALHQCKICVIPMDIIHLSPGKVSESYVDTFLKVYREYGKKVPAI